MLNLDEIREIVTQIVYEDWEFYIGEDENRVYLQLRFFAPSISTGKMEIQQGRKWLLSPRMTKSELVQTAFKAVLTAVEHEVRENFKYKKRRVYSPHFDVEALVQLSDEKKLDYRKDLE
jgi:hypothetical protein